MDINLFRASSRIRTLARVSLLAGALGALLGLGVTAAEAASASARLSAATRLNLSEQNESCAPYVIARAEQGIMKVASSRESERKRRCRNRLVA